MQNPNSSQTLDASEKCVRLILDCETFLAVPEVGENHDAVRWVIVFHSELLLYKQVPQFIF